MVPVRPREGFVLCGLVKRALSCELGVGGRVWLVVGWARPPFFVFSTCFSRSAAVCVFF